VFWGYAARHNPAMVVGMNSVLVSLRRLMACSLFVVGVSTAASGEVSAKAVCPPGQIMVTTSKGVRTCVKPRPSQQKVYTGPTVVNRLPFSSSTPTVTSASALATAFAVDATALANCSSGSFKSCAVKVWGRKDPWNLQYEGRSAEYARPWVALFAKYQSVGARIYQNLAEPGNGISDTDPVWAGYYRFEFDGFAYHYELLSSTLSSNPADWLVPGCRSCMGFKLIEVTAL